MLNWPNRITIARILLTPLLVMLAIRADEGPEYRGWMLLLFVALALTDAVDGFLARTLKQKTPLGTFLDPLADKILLATATVLLVCPIWPAAKSNDLERLMPPSIAIIVISRDVLLALGSLLAFMLTGNVVIRPSVLGKLTTAAQIVMVVAALASAPDWLLPGVFWTAAALTVASFLGYTYDWTRQLALFGGPAGENPKS